MLPEAPKSQDREAWLDCYAFTYLHYYAMQPSDHPRDREIADRWAHEMARAILCCEWAECYHDPGAKSFPKLREAAIRKRLPRVLSEFYAQRRKQREEETLRLSQQRKEEKAPENREPVLPKLGKPWDRQLSLF